MNKTTLNWFITTTLSIVIIIIGYNFFTEYWSFKRNLNELWWYFIVAGFLTVWFIQQEKLNFSKDSLNSSAFTNNSVSSPSSPRTTVAAASASASASASTAAAAVQEEEEEDAGKLEPLAFTIEFGATKKKKETPKRFVERLNSSHKRNISLTRNEDKKVKSSLKNKSKATSNWRQMRAVFWNLEWIKRV